MNAHATWTRTTWNWVLAAFAALLGAGAFAPAPARADRLDELKDRFAQRFPELEKARDAGQIGETVSGYVEAVKGDAGEGVTRLMDEENGDRRELYKLIGEKEGTTADKVAERNAARNFQKAGSGHWLKGRDGVWKQKK